MARSGMPLLFSVLGLLAQMHISPSYARAVDGELSTEFGSGTGIVLTEFGFQVEARGHGLTIQPDGKIVVVGDAGFQGLSRTWALARYQPNGDPDSTFGMQGRLTTTQPGTAHAVVAVPSTGQLVVGGTGPAVARYEDTGTLDSSFGNGGIALIPVPGSGVGAGLALLCTGKILIAGTSEFDGGHHFFVARLNTDGNIDTSFGNGGVVLVEHPDFASLSGGRLVVTPSTRLSLSPKIVIVGSQGQPSSPLKTVLIRLKENGELDSTFGGTGIVITDLSGTGIGSTGEDLGLQGTNVIVVGGVGRTPARIGLARYTSEGGLDPTFGSVGTGSVLTAFSGSPAAVSVDRNGRIVVAGRGGQVVRYLPDGLVDTSFGTEGTGIVLTTFPRNILPLISDMHIGARSLYTGGSGDDSVFALARYTYRISLRAQIGCWLRSRFAPRCNTVVMTEGCQ